MFNTAVCVLFLIKLRWPKNKCICDPLFQVRPIVSRLTHFFSWDRFFQVPPIFPRLAHLFYWDPFFQAWPIFNSVPFFEGRPIFASVTISFKFADFFQVWTYFYNCDPFFEVWPISPSVINISNGWTVLPSLTDFCKCVTRFTSASHFF